MVRCVCGWVDGIRGEEKELYVLGSINQSITRTYGVRTWYVRYVLIIDKLHI